MGSKHRCAFLVDLNCITIINDYDDSKSFCKLALKYLGLEKAICGTIVFEEGEDHKQLRTVVVSEDFDGYYPIGNGLYKKTEKGLYINNHFIPGSDSEIHNISEFLEFITGDSSGTFGMTIDYWEKE